MENFLTYKDDILYIGKSSIYELANHIQTPCYIYSLDVVEKNYLQYSDNIAKSGFDSTICFAMKSNNNVDVLSKLKTLGCGLDIVSGGELKRAIELGFNPKKIVFSGVGKTQDEIELGLDYGIYSFNVESISELELINKLAKEKNKIATVAFRFNPKVHAITHKHISTGYKTHKFGLLEEDILKTVQNEKYWSHTKLIGLSVHIGSQLRDLNATFEAIDRVCSFANKSLKDLEFIDVGGGLGVKYDPNEQDYPTIQKYIEGVFNTIGKHYKKNSIKVLFEPGRSISATCGILVSKIIRTKTSENCHFTIINSGMNDLIRPSLYEAYHEIYPSKDSKEKVTTDIVGPICESADCFAQKKELPKLSENDYLVLSHCGAYGYTMSSTYNMRSLPKEYVLEILNSL
ncbi:MAG: diaminopimelate decarboxylase [Bacteriovoracaceae bacterium]|jgi:diaminopimelate decarboxylase|nr:diaminopimelate decarboxylase [Bacteriovoracaceae bacterium]